MIKANISNNLQVHNGDFGINIAIDKYVSDLTITDFLLEAIEGNGINNIVLPDALEIAYLEDPAQTLCMIPVEIPDNVSGSFRVNMQNRLYTVNNT